MYKATLILLIIALSSACVTALFDHVGGYDSRAITVQTLDLFNQRSPSRLNKKSWKGDWIFRRDRLELIDQEIRNTKPDLLVFQGVMERTGSGAESDYKILNAGALVDYEWRLNKAETYDDTQESQSMALAVGLSLHLRASGDQGQDYWKLGRGGYMTAATVDYEEQPLLVFNVQMPPHQDGDDLWYAFIQQRIRERVVREKTCLKRVIVAGFLPGDESMRRYLDFMQALQLRDTAQGFCQIGNKCFTSTSTNDLFMATYGDESPARTDKVILHQTALLNSSSRNFEENDANNRYAREFGLTRLWPTLRFGWVANARLARCTDAELEEPLGSL